MTEVRDVWPPLAALALILAILVETRLGPAIARSLLLARLDLLEQRLVGETLRKQLRVGDHDVRALHTCIESVRANPVGWVRDLTPERLPRRPRLFAELDCTGPDCTGLDCTGLDCTGLESAAIGPATAGAAAAGRCGNAAPGAIPTPGATDRSRPGHDAHVVDLRQLLAVADDVYDIRSNVAEPQTPRMVPPRTRLGLQAARAASRQVAPGSTRSPYAVDALPYALDHSLGVLSPRPGHSPATEIQICPPPAPAPVAAPVAPVVTAVAPALDSVPATGMPSDLDDVRLALLIAYRDELLRGLHDFAARGLPVRQRRHASAMLRAERTPSVLTRTLSTPARHGQR